MHKICSFLFLLSIICSCTDNTQLIQYCEKRAPCWIPQGMENNASNIIFDTELEEYRGRQGFCNVGFTVCQEDSIRCEGVTYPETEQCDGKDNDCNGVVDDPEKFYAGIANTKCYFEETGECKYSEQACINGELVCLYDTAPNYGPEVCDGKDNDCDGEYDEEIPQNLVYSGPIETVNIGECRAGITQCENGEENIFGMILPKTELCNNSKDDDCDGLIDEQEIGLAAVDYAFFIDFSGSMLPDRLDSVLGSICSFVDNPIFANSRFAIVGIAIYSIGDIFNSNEYGLYLISDFTDINTACNLLDNVVNESLMYSVDELQLDAILRSFSETELQLDWSGNQRKIYIFSDEQPQCLQPENLNQKLSEVTQSCIVNNFTLGVFTSPDFYDYGWQDLVDDCGGFIEDIDNLSNNNYFQDNFLAWFGGSC